MKEKTKSSTISDFETITNLLGELSLAISVEEVARVVCEKGRELAGVDGVSFVVPGEGGELCELEYAGSKPLFRRGKESIGEGVFGWSYMEKTPSFVNNVFEDERTDSGRPFNQSVSSLAVIPVGNTDPIAVIGFYYQDPHEFSGRKISVMQCLSGAVEFALRNIQTMAKIDLIVAERTKALEDVNAELESFAYTVSHDLKNPLSVVRTNCWTILELMSDEVPDPAQQCVRRIDQAADRMNGQIESMLSMYRLTKQAIDAVDVNLSDFALETAKSLQAQCPERKGEFRIAGGLHAYGDERMFQVVVENLIGNAWKYSGDSDPTIIEFFSTETVEDGTVFCIRDNGVGFAKEDVDRIFRVFQRLSQTSHTAGHGIGLTSVQRIINKHGGRVWAEGEPGKGASFFFTLPALPLDTTIETFIAEQQAAALVDEGA